MLGKIFDKILRESEEEIEEIEATEVKKENAKEEKKRSILVRFGLPLLIFLLALGPRLYFMFQVSGVENAGPSWYGDVYHHWQIAYLTMTTGLKQKSFLRLWDLKGMEYFWGLLHPLILVLLFKITGSIGIIIPRLLSVFCGAGTIAVLFAILRRYFGTLTALVAAIWAIFFPVLVYSESLGMQDQLALLILIAGIYFWPKKPALTGIFFGLAAMGRSEYWIFGLGLILAAIVIERKFEQAVAVFIPWLIVTGIYMKYLLDKTGNPIYPVWWNYMGNAAGEWQVVKALSADALLGKRIFQAVCGIGAVGTLITFWKKPKAYMLLLLGFGSLIFNGIFFGFSAYIYGWLNRYYVDRLLNLPYMFAGLLLAVIFVYLLGKRFKILGVLGALVVLGILVGSQLIFWEPIMINFRKAQGGFPGEVRLAEQVAAYYEGGKLLIPEDRAPFTYALVRFNGIQGENIIGQMFDPYFYIEEEDPYDNWGENREIVLKWLEEEDIRLIAFYRDRDRYAKLVETEPDRFELAGEAGLLRVYRVN